MSTISQLLPGMDHFISLEDAKEMTARFRAEKENILVPELRNQDILSICETFNREAFDYLLAEVDCSGLRMYFGMTAELKIKVITVAVDSNDNDILPAQGAGIMPAEDGGGKIVEEGIGCPPRCPVTPL